MHHSLHASLSLVLSLTVTTPPSLYTLFGSIIGFLILSGWCQLSLWAFSAPWDQSNDELCFDHCVHAPHMMNFMGVRATRESDKISFYQRLK